jgi:peptidoglycan LD-endopeptidase CwlK
MNTASQNRLKKVHPELARRAALLIQALADKGYTIEVVQGLRTFAEQDELYKQGRTKPGQVVTKAKGGQSNHNYGLAVDLCPFVNGKPQWVHSDWD